jgi:hypothetical protein
MKLAKKQTSTAKVSQSTSTQISSHHRYTGSPYKSSFYKAIEQQCYHAKSSLKHSQQLPVKRIKSTNKIIQQTRRNNPDAYDEDDDEDDDEPSNTWAITATATVNYNDNKVKPTPVHNKQNFFVGPPVIKPISAFLGEPNKEEEVSITAVSIIHELVYTHLLSLSLLIIAQVTCTRGKDGTAVCYPEEASLYVQISKRTSNDVLINE